MSIIEEVLHLSKVEDKLKRIKRAGWLISGIYNAETVSEHLHHTCVMLLYIKKLLPKLNIDWVKCLELAIIHDMGEAYTGDIPHPKKTEKDRERELKYLKEILNILSLNDVLSEVDEGSSLEHYIYKFSELLATYSQGIIYMENGFREDYIYEIIDNTLERMDKIADETGINVLKEIVDEARKRYITIK